MFSGKQRLSLEYHLKAQNLRRWINRYLDYELSIVGQEKQIDERNS